MIWIAVIALIVPYAIWRGYVLTVLWDWFVLPFGAPDLTLAHALGISLLIAFLTYELADSESEDYPVKFLINGAAFPALALGFGAIYHGFMP